VAGGGSTDTELGSVVCGIVYDEQGKPAPNTQVMLLPSDYDALKDAATYQLLSDTTDSAGVYRFEQVSLNDYSLQAVQNALRTRAAIFGIEVGDSIVTVSPSVLSKPGVIRLALPDSLHETFGYVYIPGTTVAKWVNGASDSLDIDSVPAGVIPSVDYRLTNGAPSRVIRYAVDVPADDTVRVVLPAWKYSRRVSLNTTATGAGVSGNVTGFPILLRLAPENFDFSQANADGSDLRFTKENGAALPYEIEQWDSARQQASVWVRIDTVYGNNDTQSITMLWGNPAAADGSNSAAVFETAGGFQGVWHMGETNGTSDATANHYDGTDYGLGAQASTAGAIGSAKRFDGVTSHVQMKGTANSKLNFPQNGTYAISAWVCADTIDSTNHIIATKGHMQYFLKLKFNAVWEFVEWNDGKGDDMTQAKAKAKVWTHLVGVRNGAKQSLFVNGELMDSTITLASDSIPRDQSLDFSIGGFLKFMDDTDHEGYAYFRGVIDEVRVTNTAPSRDWVRLCYMNQKIVDALITHK
jgi:hypothetical protein